MNQAKGGARDREARPAEQGQTTGNADEIPYRTRDR
jgi:hypothetical protein